MNIRFNTISFQSNPHRERELARIAELNRLRAIQRQKELEIQRAKEREAQRVREEAKFLQSLSYPSLDDSISTKLAGFLSQFTCAIQNDSEHDVMEFFGDESTAADLRKDLSPECQADSIMLREEVQKMEEVKDPVMMLICANRMKRFAPKEGILTQVQHTNFVESIKNTVSTVVRNANFDKFEPEDKAIILELVQKVENSSTADFGIEQKLKILVDKLNLKKFKPNFIPPVQVRELTKDATKHLLK